MRHQRDHVALAARHAVVPMYHRNELSVVAWFTFPTTFVDPCHVSDRTVGEALEPRV
jgi:hypothetical protein